MRDRDGSASERVVLLLDSYNLLFRAFTSLPDSITTVDGQPINAVYGMLGAVMKLAREVGAEHAVAAFDVPDAPTFRHIRYEAYQGQRGPMGGERAEDFRRQADIARRILPLIGIAAMESAGYEADDIMGTLALPLAARGDTALIVSTDRDLLQLVRIGVHVLAPGKSGLLAQTSDDVRARMGVPPEGITTLKALAGDASDNIPGVAGIGSKTAVDLVNAYGTLEAIYAALDRLPVRTANLLRAGEADAHLFREIVTVRTDVDGVSLPAELAPVQFGPEARAREIVNRLV